MGVEPNATQDRSQVIGYLANLVPVQLPARPIQEFQKAATSRPPRTRWYLPADQMDRHTARPHRSFHQSRSDSSNRFCADDDSTPNHEYSADSDHVVQWRHRFKGHW
ncbi:hypothetical protein CA13_74040 [Planctomycetes bacterium CA13]|uniref:Uncharacterized protein n=1 Tax=Novipirellula herctigrandis TaxID=2527986 RepID=A0A5C5YIK9_9BACT|nr:hypothetical protein CA13_74040 [Planctomycetes bacterium CA13]